MSNHRFIDSILFHKVLRQTPTIYIRSKTHSNAHQSVFTKESDKYQWLVLEQKSQCEVEVRQTDSHGTITARDNYELTRNLPKSVGVERLCEGANIQIPFNDDEINLIYQFGEQSKGTGKTAGSYRGKTAQNPQQGKGGYGTMKLSRYEQESILNYNAGEQTATLYTRDKAVMRKLDTLVADFPDIYKLTGQDEVSKTYSFPKSYVSYQKPRAVSNDQRERARQMMIAKNKAKGD